MKVFNAIVMFDCFVVANSPEKAREAVKVWIKEGMTPSEEVAREVRDERSIRSSWRDQKPLVGDDVSDLDFNKHIKGHTVIEIFQHIYQKR